MDFACPRNGHDNPIFLRQTFWTLRGLIGRPLVHNEQGTHCSNRRTIGRQSNFPETNLLDFAWPGGQGSPNCLRRYKTHDSGHITQFGLGGTRTPGLSDSRVPVSHLKFVIKSGNVRTERSEQPREIYLRDVTRLLSYKPIKKLYFQARFINQYH